MRKRLSIAGGIAGIGYTLWGMAATYRHVQEPVNPWRIVLEFIVLSLFTAPLGATLGLGLGLILEGLQRILRRTSDRP
jgi:hypothetical protein